MEVALVLAEQGQLAGGADDQERDGVGPRPGERRDGIGQAGAGGDERDAGATGDTGIAVGHVGGALFVAGRKADERILVVDGIVDRQVVDARDAEGVADPRAHERINNQLTAGTCHPPLSFVLPVSPWASDPRATLCLQSTKSQRGKCLSPGSSIRGRAREGANASASLT